jgi:hypothetical protein
MEAIKRHKLCWCNKQKLRALAKNIINSVEHPRTSQPVCNSFNFLGCLPGSNQENLTNKTYHDVNRVPACFAINKDLYGEDSIITCEFRL